jgi:hypothetical protein
VLRMPKPKVCARVSSRAAAASSRLGKILTFDQLALDAPKDRGTVLLSGPRKGWRCTGILARPQEPHTATPNPMSAPRAGSSSAPEAEVPAEATKINSRSHPIITDFGSPPPPTKKDLIDQLPCSF